MLWSDHSKGCQQANIHLSIIPLVDGTEPNRFRSLLLLLSIFRAASSMINGTKMNIEAGIEGGTGTPLFVRREVVGK